MQVQTASAVVETIRDEGETTFLTPPDYKQQLGVVVYPEGSEFPRHDHLPIRHSLVGGGHGFRQLAEAVFLEIKQGPYPGVEEKERF